MSNDASNPIRKINYLITEQGGLYHQASAKLGISDSVMCVLYAIYDGGGCCLLNDIVRQSGVSKQTVNSALRKLEEEEILYLEQHRGKTKMAYLTEKGEEYARQTVARIYEAECRVFDSWSAEEIDAYVHYLEMYTEGFRTQVRRIQEEQA